MRPRVLLAALLAALTVAGPASAALPADLSADPLDRGALLALPSIYRVDVTIRVDGLRLADGTRMALHPVARTIRETGTAVAVAPGGWLVTAGHVATPDAATIARLVYQSDRAGRNLEHGDEAAAAAWVKDNGATAIRPRVRVAVSQAQAGEEGDPRAFPVLDLEAATASDLALIRIRAGAAPALALDEAASSGTPVVAIGFGTGSALDTPEPRRPIGEPAVRRGTISRTGVLDDEDPPRRALAIAVPVVQGDSGGPLVDGDGRVRGIVTRRSPQGGIAELATEVRQLLSAHDATPGTGASADLFRAAMGSFWALDFARAEDGLAAARKVFPPHALAGAEEARAVALGGGDFALVAERRRNGLLAVGILAAVAALACAAGLAVPALTRGGQGTRAR